MDVIDVFLHEEYLLFMNFKLKLSHRLHIIYNGGYTLLVYYKSYDYIKEYTHLQDTKYGSRHLRNIELCAKNFATILIGLK